MLRKVAATKDAAGYTVEAPEVARICMPWREGRTSRSTSASSSRTTTSTATTPASTASPSGDDAGFAPYLAKGASNIVLVDLQTHKTTVVTHMNPGQYALYPHFRSDGWLYFLVRDVNNGGAEHLVASDLALKLAQ